MNHGPLRRNTCIPKANVIQSAVLNWGNTFEESTCSYVSCRVSTLKNYETSTSNASIDIISTMRQLFTYLSSSMTKRRFNNCFNLHQLHVHKEPAECINLEDVAKELNDHAANSVHFPPKKMANERIDVIMKS